MQKIKPTVCRLYFFSIVDESVDEIHGGDDESE